MSRALEIQELARKPLKVEISQIGSFGSLGVPFRLEDGESLGALSRRVLWFKARGVYSGFRPTQGRSSRR